MRVFGLDRSQMKWFIQAATDVGNGRKKNQDNLYIMDSVKAPHELKSYVTQKRGKNSLLCAVFDGMGGGEKGEEVAFYAANCILERDVYSLDRLPTEQVVKMISSWIQEINDIVYNRFCEHRKVSGCTLTILYADRKRSIVWNVGDSSCIRVYKTKAEVVTVADNQADLLYRWGKITEKERWKHSGRSQLTQYIGMNPEEILLSPHVYIQEPMKRKEMYVLASDGLLETMEIEGIKAVLKRVKTSNKAMELIKIAKKNGVRDNVTIIVAGRR